MKLRNTRMLTYGHGMRKALAVVVALIAVVAVAQTVTDQYKIDLGPKDHKADHVFEQRVRIDGALTVNGATTAISNGAYFDGGITVNGALAVDGGLTVNSSLSVTTTTSLNGEVKIDAGVYVNSSVFVDGGLTIGGDGTALIRSQAVSFAYDFPSLDPVSVFGLPCAETGVVSLTGAAFGDQCLIASNLGQDGGALLLDLADLTCRVSSSGRVTAKLCMRASTDGGSVYDLGDAGFFLRTFR